MKEIENFNKYKVYDEWKNELLCKLKLCCEWDEKIKKNELKEELSEIQKELEYIVNDEKEFWENAKNKTIFWDDKFEFFINEFVVVENVFDKFLEIEKMVERYIIQITKCGFSQKCFENVVFDEYENDGIYEENVNLIDGKMLFDLKIKLLMIKHEKDEFEKIRDNASYEDLKEFYDYVDVLLIEYQKEKEKNLNILKQEMDSQNIDDVLKDEIIKKFKSSLKKYENNINYKKVIKKSENKFMKGEE